MFSRRVIVGAALLGVLAAGAYLVNNNPDAKENPQAATLPSLENILDVANTENEEALAQLLRAFGVKAAMEKLVEKTAGGSTIDCHQQAHHIGRIGYAILKERAFQECDASCHSGCYHGAMENFLHEKGTINLAENIHALCRSFPTSFGIFECLHGVGHGVLAYLNYDMPKTITQCQSLGDSFSTDSCYGGMFMENILTGQGLGAGGGVHDTIWVNREDPNYPCNAIDQDVSLQTQCYMMQTSWMLTIYGYDFDKVAQACLEAPEAYRATCFKSYGRDAAGQTLRNPEKIKELCAKLREHKFAEAQQQKYYSECVMGAANVIVDFWGPALTTQASDLCKILPPNGKEACYSALSGRLANVFGDSKKQQAVCATFEPSYQYLCRASSLPNTNASIQ